MRHERVPNSPVAEGVPCVKNVEAVEIRVKKVSLRIHELDHCGITEK